MHVRYALLKLEGGFAFIYSLHSYRKWLAAYVTAYVGFVCVSLCTVWYAFFERGEKCHSYFCSL